MEPVIDALGCDDGGDIDVTSLDVQIALERDATVSSELAHRRALAQLEQASARANPELVAIMNASAGLAATSLNTPLPRGWARLVGRISAAEHARMREANRAADSLIAYGSATALHSIRLTFWQFFFRNRCFFFFFFPQAARDAMLRALATLHSHCFVARHTRDAYAAIDIGRGRPRSPYRSLARQQHENAHTKAATQNAASSMMAQHCNSSILINIEHSCTAIAS
jgi:hypothetical protein